MTTTILYDERDCGCWIDCAYGPDHAREKLLAMLPSTDSVYPELEAASVDDTFFEEVLDDATDALQAYTADGLVWAWTAGDLVLCPEADAGELP